VSRAELEAARLLTASGQGEELPVDVQAVAAHLGAQIVLEHLDRSVSGMLYRDDDHVVIGVNSAHTERRRRFTIAHELGHLVLHKGRPLVVDHVRVNFRDATSSTATDLEEIQANAFAAELLMPRDQVTATARQGLKAAATQGAEAAAVRDLADGFDVSEQAMDYRLINLGLRRQV
jgi:Zn-dependent peptidase ImmA (M78 family)